MEQPPVNSLQMVSCVLHRQLLLCVVDQFFLFQMASAFALHGPSIRMPRKTASSYRKWHQNNLRFGSY